MALNYPCSDLFQSFLNARGIYRNNLTGQIPLFDIIAEYERECCDKILFPDISKRMELLLKNERNSWRLIKGVFDDRLRDLEEQPWDGEGNEMIVDGFLKRMSDKDVIDAYFERNSMARLMQLVLDWLEQNEREDMDMEKYADKIEFYSDGPHCWENTLHDLKNRQKNLFVSETLTAELDPDAPFRLNGVLNDSDRDDESRLIKHILKYLRAGRLDISKSVADKLGYYWLSAVLYGWVLFMDPNFQDTMSEDPTLLMSCGNSCRDLWKFTCFKYSQLEDKNKSLYETALFGLLGGNLKPALNFFNRWSDRLWLYTRASLDCFIEQELRNLSVPNVVTARASDPIRNLSRVSTELPAEYWQNMKSFSDIFKEIDNMIKDEFLDVIEECHYKVQKLIILEDIDGLLEYMVEWIKKNSTDNETRPHILRFFAHLVLFLSEIDSVNTDARISFKVFILEEFISYLIDWKEIKLVAPYVAHLPSQIQVETYTKLLIKITDPRERQVSYSYAKEAGLDLNAITKKVLHVVRDDQIPQYNLKKQIFDSTHPLEVDSFKINSLDWLLIDGTNYIELLLHSNALVRQFLLQSRIDSAKATLTKLPSNLVDGAMQEFKKKVPRSNYSPYFQSAVNEHLDYISYIQALETFDEWLSYYTKSKPSEPKKPTEQRLNAKFEYERRLNEYKRNFKEWKNSTVRLAFNVEEQILKILCPSERVWMNPEQSEDLDENRLNQMNLLRKEKIPQIVLVYHTVLFSSNLYKESMRIAQVVADEKYGLYKEFTKEQLGILLHKVRESSIQVLHDESDCLCWPLFLN